MLSESRIVMFEKSGNKGDLYQILKKIDLLLDKSLEFNYGMSNIKSTFLDDHLLNNKWVVKVLNQNGYMIFRSNLQQKAYIKKN